MNYKSEFSNGVGLECAPCEQHGLVPQPVPLESIEPHMFIYLFLEKKNMLRLHN